jgi:hypothetical protein
METWVIQQPRSYVWPLTKAAGFWLLFAQLALTRAYFLETSPVPLLCFATGAFIIHTMVVLFGSVVSDGLSLRLCFSAALFLTLGLSTLSSVNTINEAKAPGPDWILQIAGQGMDYLVASAERIPINQTQQSFSVTEHSAKAQPAEAQQSESSKSVTQKPPLEIVALQRTQNGLQVTVLNTLGKTIRTVRYHATYFGASKAGYVEGSTNSSISRDIRPGTKSTFELPDDPANGVFYGSFTVVGWE